jgi:hypothetical protein
MGVFQYYLNCSKRKKYLARIKAINEDDNEQKGKAETEAKKKEIELARLAHEREIRNRHMRENGKFSENMNAKGPLDLYGNDSTSKKKKKREKKHGDGIAAKKEKLRKEKKKENKRKQRKDR